MTSPISHQVQCLALSIAVISVSLYLSLTSPEAFLVLTSLGGHLPLNNSVSPILPSAFLSYHSRLQSLLGLLSLWSARLGLGVFVTVMPSWPLCNLTLSWFHSLVLCVC